MRHLRLVGTSREVEFRPGLNVIEGDTTTGKTSLMRLLRVLLGTDYDGIIPELRRVAHVGGEVLIGDELYAVVRLLRQTETAPVDLAGENLALRLPAMQPRRPGEQTYGAWLIEQLRLPELRIPTAPSRPEEGATTPVSIADYLRYCRLTQTQIVSDILGSSNFFTDYKRRVAFRIYFGSFDAQIAALQEQLRETEADLRALRAGTTALDRFLAGSPLANRAVLERDLAAGRERLAASEHAQRELAETARAEPRVREIQEAARVAERELVELDARREAECRAREQLVELAQQLSAQSARLTKAVVANAHLVDYEFRVCPRCGREVDPGRAEADHCHLCLQEPSEQLTREDLLVEQARIEAQIDETHELVALHTTSIGEIETAAGVAHARRDQLGRELDALNARFVSDEAERIGDLRATQAQAVEQIASAERALRLLDRADRDRASAEQLQERKLALEVALRRAERFDAEAEARLDRLEANFAQLVEALALPRFETDAEPRAAINPTNFEPIVNGRMLERHSGGMAVMINVAYMLAIHQTAIELNLAIPQLLMIDGINQNLGRGEYDSARYELIWRQLLAFSERHGHEHQIIVAANDVPSFVAELDVVRLRLTAADRLVPLDELAQAGAAGEQGGDPLDPDPSLSNGA